MRVLIIYKICVYIYVWKFLCDFITYVYNKFNLFWNIVDPCALAVGWLRNLIDFSASTAFIAAWAGVRVRVLLSVRLNGIVTWHLNINAICGFFCLENVSVRTYYKKFYFFFEKLTNILWFKTFFLLTADQRNTADPYGMSFYIANGTKFICNELHDIAIFRFEFRSSDQNLLN